MREDRVRKDVDTKVDVDANEAAEGGRAVQKSARKPMVINLPIESKERAQGWVGDEGRSCETRSRGRLWSTASLVMRERLLCLPEVTCARPERDLLAEMHEPG